MAENVNKSVKQATTPEMPVKKKVNLEYLRDKDREPVKGIFHFHEVPGGKLSFPYKAYKGDKVITYELTDGAITTIPLGLARHLNKDCWYPVHEHRLDESGRPSEVIGKKVKRCSFESLEFVDIGDIGITGESIITEPGIIRQSA